MNYNQNQKSQNKIFISLLSIRQISQQFYHDNNCKQFRLRLLTITIEKFL